MYHGERFNSWSHLAGVALALIGLVLLVRTALDSDNIWRIVSFSLYGATLVLLYLCSTLYHSVRQTKTKALMRKLDHSAIFFLIAGSYTPYCLVTLRGPWGWSLFGVSWGLAVFGVFYELVLGRRWEWLSVTLYLVMGWLVLVAIWPLINALSTPGLIWLALGGVVYSAGVYWYVNDEKIRHGHGIWHLFVLGGSICQFVGIVRFV